MGNSWLDERAYVQQVTQAVFFPNGRIFPIQTWWGMCWERLDFWAHQQDGAVVPQKALVTVRTSWKCTAIPFSSVQIVNGELSPQSARPVSPTWEFPICWSWAYWFTNSVGCAGCSFRCCWAAPVSLTLADNVVHQPRPTIKIMLLLFTHGSEHELDLWGRLRRRRDVNPQISTHNNLDWSNGMRRTATSNQIVPQHADRPSNFMWKHALVANVQGSLLIL